VNKKMTRIIALVMAGIMIFGLAGTIFTALA
jgi:hypothetical protein